jgi:hypothetical protein
MAGTGRIGGEQQVAGTQHERFPVAHHEFECADLGPSMQKLLHHMLMQAPDSEPTDNAV